MKDVIVIYLSFHGEENPFESETQKEKHSTSFSQKKNSLSPPIPTPNSHLLALQESPQLPALLQHRPPRATSLGVPPLCRGLKVPNRGHVVGEQRVDSPEVGRAQVGESAASVLGHLHSGAAEVVGLAEWDPFFVNFDFEEAKEGEKEG